MKIIDRESLTEDHNITGNTMIIDKEGNNLISSYINTDISRKDNNYIIMDINGRLHLRYSGFLKDNGYKVYLFDPWQAVSSDHYNPFAHASCEINVLNFIDAFICLQDLDKKQDDVFARDPAALLLTSLALYVWSVIPKEEQSFNKMIELLEAGPEYIDEKMKEITDKDPACLATVQYKRFKCCTGNQKEAIRILKERLQIFRLSDIKTLMSDDNIDLEHFSTTPKAIFITVDLNNKGFTPLFSMFIQQACTALWRTENTRHTKFILFGYEKFYFQDFEIFITRRAKQADISFDIFVPDIASIKNIRSTKFESVDIFKIIHSCDSIIFFDSEDLVSIEFMLSVRNRRKISRYLNRRDPLSKPKSLYELCHNSSNTILFIKNQKNTYDMVIDAPIWKEEKNE